MEARELECRTSDGRRLLATVAGPENGDLVVFHNGTPGSRRLYESDLAAGVSRGVRHVCYSRPGYEGSDRQPGRTFADCAADTVAVADALGASTFHVVGASGGGPHVLACAALLPDRVTSAAVVATFGVRKGREEDWMTGTGPKNVEEFDALDAGTLEPFLRKAAAEWAGIKTRVDYLEALDGFLCPADVDCLAGPYLAYVLVLASVARISRDEIWGWFDDDHAIVGDWGFDLSRISVPLSIWHGKEDLVVPVGEGEWVGEQVSHAEVHLLEGEGHVSSMARHYEKVLDELIAAVP